MRKTGFQGDFAAFLTFLRTDPRFYAKTPEELLEARLRSSPSGWTASCRRSSAAAAPAVRRRAGARRTSRPSTPAAATSGRRSAARGPGPTGSTPTRSTSRPLYTLEALTLHEAVPGHHLQIALQQELTGLPAFRRFSGVGAFVEGWGLYSERLGLEAGFYQDPYSDFGRLTYEMWRACRLVVDTGHARAWAGRAQQAIDYLASNTALSLHEVRDRDRPLHLLARPGPLLQDGRAEDPGAARAGRDGARAALRHPRLPRRGPRATARAAAGARGAGRRVDRGGGGGQSHERGSRREAPFGPGTRRPASGSRASSSSRRPARSTRPRARAERAFEAVRRPCRPARRAEFLRAIAQQIAGPRGAAARARRRRDGPAAGAPRERARAHGRPDPPLRRADRGRLLGRRPHRPRAPGPQAPAAAGPAAHARRRSGPVAVFGASNFPLAFSVAGGDTVSALAAGCPVVVKAHPAHPGTSELAAAAIRTAARETRMPEGVFGMVHGASPEVGITLVTHPAIRAGGIHGLSARRADALRRGGHAARADPGLRRDGLLQSRVPPAGSAGRARRRRSPGASRLRSRSAPASSARTPGLAILIDSPRLERVSPGGRGAARGLARRHDGARRDQGGLRPGRRRGRPDRRRRRRGPRAGRGRPPGDRGPRGAL